MSQAELSIITALSSMGNLKITSLGELAKIAGFKSVNNKVFREALENLQKKGIIEIQQGGFTGDSMHHRKMVVLKADVMYFYEEYQSEEYKEESEELKDYIVVSVKDEKEKRVHDEMRIQIPHLPLMIRFFQLLLKRKFTKSKRMLNKIESKLPKGNYYVGILAALKGMFDALYEDKKYLFMPKAINLTLNELKDLHRKFYEKVRLAIHMPFLVPSYDMGYFLAWDTFIRFLIKLKENEKFKIVILKD